MEPDGKRRELGKRLGAHIIIDPAAEDALACIKEITGGGAHIVFFTVNSLQLAQDYIRVLAPKGRLIYYGSFHPKGDIAMDPNKVHYAEWMLTGAYSPTVKGFWTATRLLSHNLIDPSAFISE